MLSTRRIPQLARVERATLLNRMARGPLQGDECATCGLLYERFRDVSVSFVEAYQEVFAESVEACAAGN